MMQKAETNTMETKVCFICDTPYQIFTILNYVIHQDEFETEDMDICICTRDISGEQIGKIIQSNIFRNVYQYNTDLEQSKDKKNLLFRLNRFVRPRHYYMSFFRDNDFDIKRYNYLFCAFPIPITVAMTMVNPDINIRLFDDGIGTYINGIPSPDSKKRRMLFRLKGKSSPWGRIEKIYVYNDNLYSGHLAKEVVPLTSVGCADSRFHEVVKSVFNYKESELYDLYRGIYLTQPLETVFDNQTLFWSIEHGIIDVISKCSLPFVLRKHPKHKTYPENRMHEDLDNDFWELICAKQITNDHILVSCYSTAQFSPKFLFDKEPWLIFTYYFFKNLFGENKIEEMDKMIERLRESYSNKSKVIVAYDSNDLKNKLKKLQEGYES